LYGEPNSTGGLRRALDVARGASFGLVSVASGCGLISSGSYFIHLLDRTACRTIRYIRVRNLERPSAVGAAAGVELRGMVREGEQVFAKKIIKAKPRGVELWLSFVEPLLRDQRVGKTRPDLRIAAPKHWHE
jgi:hypothetical protein